MNITGTVGFFMSTCIFIITYGGLVDAIRVSLSTSPGQVQAGSILSLTCSVDEDPALLLQVFFSRNNFSTVAVSPVATCTKKVVGTKPDVYNLTCDPNNRWFQLDIISVDSKNHGDKWTCDMASGPGGSCLGNPHPCVSGPASVFILIPVTTVRLTDNNDVSVTSPVDVSESSNGLTLKCNTGPTGSRPVSNITWWKMGDSMSTKRITANVTALPSTSLGNDIYISNTRLVISDRSYNGLKIYCTAPPVMSGKIQLNVKWRPNVTLQIGGQSYTVYKVPESQTNVVFTCTSGPVNPAITGYSWRHNSSILVNEVTNTYTISSVSQSHDGLYTCSATNVEGTGTSAAMDLDVLPHPLRPTDLKVVTTDINAAYLVWVPAIIRGSQQSFKVQYRSMEDLEFSSYSGNFTDDGHIYLLATVDGLQENTAYSFRVFSRNLYGDSPVTEEVRAQTKPSGKCYDWEMSSIAGPIIGAVVVIVSIGILAVFLCKHTRKCAEDANQRSESQTPTDDGAVPVYLELNQSPTDQQVDGDVSTSGYESLDMNESSA